MLLVFHLVNGRPFALQICGTIYSINGFVIRVIALKGDAIVFIIACIAAMKEGNMKKLFELGNRYAANSDWTDFALTKFCLCSMGVLIGVSLPPKDREIAVPVACGVFAATYIPLMKRVFVTAKEMMDK